MQYIWKWKCPKCKSGGKLEGVSAETPELDKAEAAARAHMEILPGCSGIADFFEEQAGRKTSAKTTAKKNKAA